MKLSRHARNNMRLYRISREEIEDVLAHPDRVEAEGPRRVAYKTFPSRFGGLPLKVVYVEEQGEIVVITAYPLKRGFRRRELPQG